MYAGRSAEVPSFGDLLRESFKRLRRKWLSLRFRGAQIGTIAFSKSFLFKMAFLALASYYLFGGQHDSGSFLAAANGIEPILEETTLGVGTPAKKTKNKQTKAVTKPKPKPISDAAPVSRDKLKSDQTLSYIKKYSAIARQEMYKYGVPASISLAQGLVESRAGTSKLARENNNHFGMKCFSRNCKKGHCSNHTDDTHKDFFLKFKDSKDSWRAHSMLISTGRYAKLKKYGRDYRRWANGLKSVGYATDRTYAQKLIGIIERYDLDQYDK